MNDNKTILLDEIAGWELPEIVNRLKGYNKILSMIYLRLMDLPSLNGILLFSTTKGAIKVAKQWFTKKGWNKAVIRTDKRGEKPDAPRGGDCVDLENLEKTLAFYREPGRVIMLLEPRSRYSNLYSINVLVEKSEPDLFYLEVVGPGFDASDINRGDITPHERIWISSLGRGSKVLDDRKVRREKVTSAEYRRSVQRRLAKIAKRARLGHWGDLSSLSDAALTEEGKMFLRSLGKKLLLQHLDKYIVLPSHLLNRLWAYIQPVPKKLELLGESDELYVISLSIFERNEEFVFWDISFPKRKYNI